ncbi:TetR family transcriptional regulator [Amycolatopsis sp. K13G38]|uniref:TetR family transcriptional regulator n=1 Tax=Amycolatopsis acididurans TaxID=2724524 RepID=A0ABX1JEQ2_9PSEU|nr:TetR family transcriptional regulator C-terminal domain-containing protein [Amycolatopsis acididurans]NKQ58176.1 TetR family transcriptional regulator [Amycolatopsis acididurans]
MPKIVDPESRRAEVADALFRLAEREGLHRVSLRTVAAEAGLNVGSVRHYFDSQAELMRFAMRSMIDRVSARLERRVEALGDPARLPRGTRRRHAAELLCELLPLDRDRRAEATVFLEFVTAARTDPALADLAREAAEGTRALVRRVLEPSEVDDLELEVRRLTALLDGLSFDGVLHPDSLTPRQAEAVVLAHLEGL